VSDDEKFAKELWEEEQNARNTLSAQQKWEQEVASLKAAAKIEADDKIKKAKEEKDRIQRELQKLEYDRLKKQNEFESKTFEGILFPDHWSKQAKDLQIFEVAKYSEEFNKIAKRFNETAPGTTITKIERNQNRTQWTFYFLQREKIALKNHKNPNEMHLYHGSRAKAYQIILTTGFDHRVANMGGAIGAGTYFATHASYSKNYTTESRMLYCRVTVGKVGNGQSGIRKPPAGCDSVASVSNGNGMYVVFDNYQCYPEYMIYYTG